MPLLFLFMTKVIFLFFASFFLLLAIFSGNFQLSLEKQLFYSLALIFIFGIPHGAIDHVIFLHRRAISKWKFYFSYLGGVLINILLWIYFPAIAFFLFLLLSAYHFGQSQLSHYAIKGFTNKLLYFSWGLALLLGMLSLNQVEILKMITQMEDFEQLSIFLSGSLLAISFYFFLALTVLLLLRNWWQKNLKTDQFFMELLVYALAFVSFFVFPLLIGFTLYFIVLHSIKVLGEEYDFVNRYLKNHISIGRFVQLLLPFSMLSLGGLILIYFLTQSSFLQFPFGYVLLIMISSITMPHAFVMEYFYRFKIAESRAE